MLLYICFCSFSFHTMFFYTDSHSRSLLFPEWNVHFLPFLVSVFFLYNLSVLIFLASFSYDALPYVFIKQDTLFSSFPCFKFALVFNLLWRKFYTSSQALLDFSTRCEKSILFIHACSPCVCIRHSCFSRLFWRSTETQKRERYGSERSMAVGRR